MKRSQKAASSFDLFDKITDKLEKAEAIAYLMGVGGIGQEIPDNCLPNASLAVADLLAEARIALGKLHEVKTSNVVSTGGAA